MGRPQLPELLVRVPFLSPHSSFLASTSANSPPACAACGDRGNMLYRSLASVDIPLQPAACSELALPPSMAGNYFLTANVLDRLSRTHQNRANIFFPRGVAASRRLVHPISSICTDS